MQRKNYVKKEYCCPELSVIPVSAEPIMGTNSPFESDHKKADDGVSPKTQLQAYSLKHTIS